MNSYVFYPATAAIRPMVNKCWFKDTCEINDLFIPLLQEHTDF